MGDYWMRDRQEQRSDSIAGKAGRVGQTWRRLRLEQEEPKHTEKTRCEPVAGPRLGPVTFPLLQPSCVWEGIRIGHPMSRAVFPDLPNRFAKPGGPMFPSLMPIQDLIAIWGTEVGVVLRVQHCFFTNLPSWAPQVEPSVR